MALSTLFLAHAHGSMLFCAPLRSLILFSFFCSINIISFLYMLFLSLSSCFFCWDPSFNFHSSLTFTFGWMVGFLYIIPILLYGTFRMPVASNSPPRGVPARTSLVSLFSRRTLLRFALFLYLHKFWFIASSRTHRICIAPNIPYSHLFLFLSLHTHFLVWDNIA